MRIAVFRGWLTINVGTDPTYALVERLRALGHDVLHVTAVASPVQVIEGPLERDLVSSEAVASFDPQALVVVIPNSTHRYYPHELIEMVVRAGGTIVYLGPAGGDCAGDAPAIRFLAARGFYFQSLTPKGPQPIRSWGAASINLRPDGQGTVPLDGVYFLEVRTPYVLAEQTEQMPLLEVPTQECCTWDGIPVPDGMGLIAAVRVAAGREVLLTGDWLSPSSLAAWSCNFQLIANLLMGAPSGNLQPLAWPMSQGVRSGLQWRSAPPRSVVRSLT